MEAPEKLYISDYGDYNWHPKRSAVKDIEYIRKDVLIEKASKFLFDNYHGKKLSLKMIENFKKYMKE